MPKSFFVYILSNPARQLYIGVTSNIDRRVWEHRSGAVPGYTQPHRIHELVYWEMTPNARAAIAREKELKNLKRRRKIELVESMNPEWRDLYQPALPLSP